MNIKMMIDGQLIPKGAIVNIIISAIHRDPSVYPNPDEFDPTRFAENSVINEQRSPFAFIPFSAGSRNCIGKLLLHSMNDRRKDDSCCIRSTFC